MSQRVSMRKQRWFVAPLLALSLLAAACGDSDDSTTDTTAAGDTTTTQAALAVPTFAAGSAMEALQKKGKLVVGTKFDQPGFGLKNPTSGEVEGFDAEVAKLVAVGIFGGTVDDVASKVEFVEAVSKTRESLISNGTVDYVVATYTINDERKQLVGFAGPYFVAQQDIMTKADDSAINSVTDLDGKKVCTVKGSTSEKNVIAKAPKAELLLFDTYSQCAEALTDGRVVAVTTDNTILAGLVNASNDAFKLIKAPFSDEPYGIGVKKESADLRNFVNDRLEEIYASGEWASAFEDTLGSIGLDTPEPPAVNRYT